MRLYLKLFLFIVVGLLLSSILKTYSRQQEAWRLVSQPIVSRDKDQLRANSDRTLELAGYEFEK